MTETCLPIVTWLKNWFTSTDDLLDKTYPIGSIYMSVNSTSPSTLFGGTWVQLENTFLYATSTTADANSTTSTGGSATNTHHHWQTFGADANYIYGNLDKTSIDSKVESHSRIRVAKQNQSTDNMRFDTTYNETINIMPPHMKVYMWKRTA